MRMMLERNSSYNQQNMLLSLRRKSLFKYLAVKRLSMNVVLYDRFSFLLISIQSTSEILEIHYVHCDLQKRIKTVSQKRDTSLRQ